MRAAQISAYGGKDAVSTVSTASLPVAGDGQVLVEVYAAGVNPYDYKVREGMTQSYAPLEFPATLGGDVAGVVTGIGSNVDGFKVGDHVFGEANATGGEGSFAEFTPVKATQLALKPQTLDFVSAAALPLVAAAAVQALIDTLQLAAGQKILIHGGAGGIGSMAIQLAKHIGAYVASTATGPDVEFVRALGANEVIDYQQEDFASKLKDFDAVFDTVGGDTYRKSFAVLRRDGKIASMVEKPDEALMTQYGVTAVWMSVSATTELLGRITELVDKGALKVNIDKVFSLEEAAEALEYLKSGQHRGKVVIKIRD